MIFCLEQDTQFLSGRYFAFSGYPIKKKNRTNYCSKLSLVRNSKNLKIAKNQLTRKFCSGDNTVLSINSDLIICIWPVYRMFKRSDKAMIVKLMNIFPFLFQEKKLEERRKRFAADRERLEKEQGVSDWCFFIN